jgi:hypothetical protein
MSGRWLRNKDDGTIYGWHAILAVNPKCEEVTHEQAFPRLYVSAESTKKMTTARKGKRIPLVDDERIAPDDDVQNILADLSADASRGLDK